MTLEIEGRIFEAIRGPDVGMYLSATWTHYVSYTPETETREAIIRMSDEQWINMAASMVDLSSFYGVDLDGYREIAFGWDDESAFGWIDFGSLSLNMEESQVMQLAKYIHDSVREGQ
jgi:hypothetical protein